LTYIDTTDSLGVGLGSGQSLVLSIPPHSYKLEVLVDVQGNVTSRLSEAGPAYAWQLSRTSRMSSHTNTCLFCALFLIHAHSGRTFRSVTHHSRLSMLNFGVFFEVFGKEVETCW
jgi:hypothetical protein